MSRDQDKDLARVLALIELATSPGTPEHEASAAAMAACRRIKQDGLLALLSAGGEGLVGREDVVVVTIPFLILNQSEHVFRVSRLEPPRKHSSHVLLIPKEYVRKSVMMTNDEAKALGWDGGLIIKSLTLVRAYFNTARQSGWDDWS